MKYTEKKAYEKLIEELKNEFPFFKKYNADFFFNKKNEELKKGDNFQSFFKNKEHKNDVKEYSNFLVEEMEKSFNILEKNNSINNLCNIFLRNFDNSTNDYYDYINSNYVSSRTVKKVMKNYIKRDSLNNESVKINNMKMKKIGNEINNNNNKNIAINSHKIKKTDSYIMKNPKIKENKLQINKQKKKSEENNSDSSEEKCEIKNSFEDEIKNNDVGFCDISFIPFTNNYFHINYGCFNLNLYNENLNSVFMIENMKKDKDGLAKYKRSIIFGDLGKENFLKNIKKHSIVRGWIYKYDSVYKCFFVRIFSIRNVCNNEKKAEIIKKNRKNDNCIYACLPFQFINKYEFVNSLSIDGLPFHDLEKFIGMNICGEVFDDKKYIYAHFKDIFYKCNFHFFITFNSKYYCNNDKFGFISNHLNGDIFKKKNKYNDYLLNYFNILLFSCKKFQNLENLNYKGKYLLLNVSQMPSLIKFNFRNNICQMHIGNIITKKQNLIWSNEKFIEAFEIYKHNSEYYNFLKNYFYLDSFTKNCKYIYVYEEDKFIIENDFMEKIEDVKKHIRKTNKNNNEKKNNLENKEFFNIENSYIKKTDKEEFIKNYNEYYLALDDKEKYIIKNIIFLNANLYKKKWIYDFFNCIKLTINLNNQNVLANFLLSLVLLELSCYTESFLFLFRIFKIKKVFLDSYKLKKIICSIFIKQLKKYINKENIWNVIINFQNYDLFNMREDNCEEYCRNIFKRNINIINTLEKM
ncbi:conserved Plasmodium protein, unknown function [Plasmodium gallinaceum]|uniref:Uncharacterized protein n=1 Tax=Plasmodium gallinaceum TaxID=5849 RepID=A0A1J1GQE5_PLAGA|nr:conserved Plasmodium protein, unknown function [Plasmodium gallinaceum]CRG93266.1 conserved Plasmodium protein, unknown function [Plasmodium gallinaceum]